MYHIVEFKSVNGLEVAIVPQNWLKDDKYVHWPPHKTLIRLNNAARNMEPPSETCSLEKINRIMYSNEDFDRVRNKLRQSEDNSDLQTSDDDQKRKRRPARKLYSSSDEDSSNGDDEGISDSRPSESKSIHRTPKQTPSPTVAKQTPSPTVEAFSPPPCIPSQALKEISNEVSRPLTPVPGPFETPSRGQFIGQNATSQIFTVLETIREENREMKRLLQRLVARSATDNDQSLQLPEDIVFPVTTVEEMETFDDLLFDQSKKSSVVKYLSVFGGGDVRETVDRILKEVILIRLAREYNMKGLKGKRKFSSLQILNVLYTRLFGRNTKVLS